MGRRYSAVWCGCVCLAATAFSSGICAGADESGLLLTPEVQSHGQLVTDAPMHPPLASTPAEWPLTPMPPGTLGQTYTRPSHPVPDDEHPRTAMLAVRDHEKVPFLKAQNMSGIRMKSGIWLFESVRPLDPGACQIIRVEARQSDKDIEPYSTKFVRLIPGRIVYLDF